MDAYKSYWIEKIGMANTDADLFLPGFESLKFKRGDKCNLVRILLQACARGFVAVGSKEVTTNFYFEYDHTYDDISYLKQQKGDIIFKL